MNTINNAFCNTINNCISQNAAIDPYANGTQAPIAPDIAEEIIRNMPKQKVGFLAVNPATGKSVHYGSADCPLKRIGEK